MSVVNGWIDAWMDGWLAGWMDGWMDGRIHAEVYRWTGKSIEQVNSTPCRRRRLGRAKSRHLHEGLQISAA